MATFDARIIVVVNCRGRISVVNRVAEGLEVEDHIPHVDCDARTHVGGTNFSFTRAERSAFLSLGFPCEGATRAKNYGTTHTAIFEEW